MTAEPLFRAPDAPSERVRLPLGVSASWLAAVEAAGWQCQQTDPAKGRRCEHRGRGAAPWRLYLIRAEGGPLVLCEPCAGKRAARDRRTVKAAGPEAEPLF